jgi:hypothetical protein
MVGLQTGPGICAVADWLEMPRGVDEDMEAAAAPATTTDKAKIRMASFMIDYPCKLELTEKASSCTLKS